MTSIIAQNGKWTAQELELSWEKINLLWNKMQQHKTLFSDLTRGDMDNFVRLLVQPQSFWIEIVNDEGEIVGVVYLDDFGDVVDVTVHLVFFDRQPAEKLELCKAIMLYVFGNFPVNRITAPTPDIYHASKRLLGRLGFTLEGTQREKVLMGGNWINMALYGITRREVLNGIPSG